MPGYINSNDNKLQEEGNHIVTYQSGPSKTENYCLVVRNDQRKFVKDIKALLSEEFITQQNPLICDANK